MESVKDRVRQLNVAAAIAFVTIMLLFAVGTVPALVRAGVLREFRDVAGLEGVDPVVIVIGALLLLLVGLSVGCYGSPAVSKNSSSSFRCPARRWCNSVGPVMSSDSATSWALLPRGDSK